MKQKKVEGRLDKLRKNDDSNRRHLRPYGVCTSLKYFLGERKITKKRDMMDRRHIGIDHHSFKIK